MKVNNKFKKRQLLLRDCKAGDVVTFPHGFFRSGPLGTPYFIPDKPVIRDHGCYMRWIINPASGYTTQVNNNFDVTQLDTELVIKGVLR